MKYPEEENFMLGKYQETQTLIFGTTDANVIESVSPQYDTLDKELVDRINACDARRIFSAIITVASL